MGHELPTEIWRPLKRGSLGLGIILVFVALWSAFAKLSTTIHVTGRLVSSSPSIQIQHPFGGTVNWVGVKLHEAVEEGVPLFRFDARVEEQALAELEVQRGLALRESDIIEMVLDDPVALNTAELGPVASRYAAEEAAIEAQINSLQRREKVQRARLSGSRNEQRILQESKAVLEKTLDNQRTLFHKKLTRETELTALVQRALQFEEQISRTEAAAAVLEEELVQTGFEIDRVIAQRQADLLTRGRDIERQLSEYRKEEVRLRAIIQASEITAPVTGQIQSLPVLTAGIFVPRGETVAEIADTLTAPELEISIPVTFIDQVQVGMGGRMTIPSLPQRDVATIFIELTAISPEAEIDRDGNPTEYKAKAKILNLDALELFEQEKRLFRLSADMPISIALSGRTITFAGYLLKPFFSAFTTALQD